ncbi:SMP-30/gluconolactonase/LRE family protein [Microbacterium sp. BR1]|uniref:SMP-30/gluconolactonase/LRE family protein n=1 Tax=Microbacterium sp. BR1 TaxID=1070896 RepID=UPI000C2C2D57|nr:SMP-30/gluconolactonase/LRE family protein [Microbacterium sp. BR1]
MHTWKLDDHGSDAGYAEGPVLLEDGGLLTVAIDRGEILEWRDGTATVIAVPAGGPNGLARDRSGRLFVAQNGGQHPGVPTPGVTGGVQTVVNGSVDWLSTEPTSPNDLAFGPDGLLYVTDPTRKPERDEGRIWRIQPDSGEAELLLTVDWYPNGIGFSDRDDLLWLADTRHGRIVTFRLDEHGLGDERTWAMTGDALPDGFAFDTDGNLHVCCVGLGQVESAVIVFNADGTQIARAELPASSRFITNLAIDQAGRTWVTDSDRQRILVGHWGVSGLPLHPFR